MKKFVFAALAALTLLAAPMLASAAPVGFSSDASNVQGGSQG